MENTKKCKLKKIAKKLDNGYCIVYVQLTGSYNCLMEYITLRKEMEEVGLNKEFEFREGTGTMICETYYNDGDYILPVERKIPLINFIELC